MPSTRWRRTKSFRTRSAATSTSTSSRPSATSGRSTSSASAAGRSPGTWPSTSWYQLVLWGWMDRERWRDVATDHFDVAGQRFFNPWGQVDRGIPDLVRWWATAKREPWPASVTNRSYLAPPGAVPEGQAAITMIGHAGVLVQVDGFTLLTDPHFSTHAGPGGRLGTRRVRPPGIEPRDLPAVNAVFISHNHYDHL